MSDVFDMAKPVRDSVLIEMQRTAPGTAAMAERDAIALGAHFVALMAAWGSKRHNTMCGVVSDPDLQVVLCGAIAQLIANAAASFRPSFHGRLLTPTENTAAMLEAIVRGTFAQAHGIEHGYAEIAMPIRRDAAGGLHTTLPDVMAMLGAKR